MSVNTLIDYQSYELIYHQAHIRVSDEDNPMIAPFNLGMVLTSKVLVVQPLNPYALPEWQDAGWLRQVGNNTLFAPIGEDDALIELDKKQIAINKLQLLLFNTKVDTFELIFEPRPYINALELRLWQFNGDTSLFFSQGGGTVDLAALVQQVLAQLPPYPVIPSLSALGGVPLAQKGQPGGVAELDANRKVPSAQLPPYPVIPTLVQLGGVTASQVQQQIQGYLAGLLGAAGGIATLGNDGVLAATQRPPQTGQSSGSSSGSAELTFSSTGDANGLFYYLGTEGIQKNWFNPSTSKVVTISKSSGSSSTDFLVDRQLSAWATSNTANQWVAIDLGSRYKLLIKHYIVQHDGEGGYQLRNWKLQGSNNPASNSVTDINAATWVDLKTHANDTSIQGGSGWGSFPVPDISTAYRWLRILSTGKNASGSNYLVLGEIELYGTLLKG